MVESCSVLRLVAQFECRVSEEYKYDVQGDVEGQGLGGVMHGGVFEEEKGDL